MAISDYLLNRTAIPVELPVTVTEMKTDLRVQHTSEDSFIESLILAATDYMDVPNGAIGKAIMSQTWALKLCSFGALGKVDIPVTPVQSITSIAYFDVDNVAQTLNVSDFYLFGDENSAWIEPKPNVDIPAVYSRPDAITITFLAGFGNDCEDVPNSIRQAIRLLAGHWYENRTPVVIGTTVTDLPMAVGSLINMNRKGWVA